MKHVNLLHNNYNRIGPVDVTFRNKHSHSSLLHRHCHSLVSKFHSIVVKEITSHNVLTMGEPSFPIPKPNTAEGEFMSNAAIGCLSFGARSERHRRPTAAEHSFRSSLFKRVTQTLLETICVRVA